MQLFGGMNYKHPEQEKEGPISRNGTKWHVK